MGASLGIINSLQVCTIYDPQGKFGLNGWGRELNIDIHVGINRGFKSLILENNWSKKLKFGVKASSGSKD